jgi:hypothetical protein
MELFATLQREHGACNPGIVDAGKMMAANHAEETGPIIFP